jgi:hypothetical protein
VNISAAIHAKSEPLAQTFLIGAEYIDADPSVLILEGNVISRVRPPDKLYRASTSRLGAMFLRAPIR